MFKLCAVAVWALFLLLIVASWCDQGINAQEAVAPVVRIHSGWSNVGSGVIIESWKGGALVLTAAHVLVSDAETKIETFDRYGCIIGIHSAVVLRSSADEDLALLWLPSKEKLPYARLLPVDGRGLELTEPVWAVGCTMGLDPVLTTGNLADTYVYRPSGEFFLVTADGEVGNSGGPVYVRRGRGLYLAGVQCQLGCDSAGTSIEHLVFSVPFWRIHRWLSSVGVE